MSPGLPSPCRGSCHTLSRYLLRAALPPALLLTGLLCALVFGLQALRLGHHLVGSGGGLLLLAAVAAYALPSLLVAALPLALGGGILLAAGRRQTELEAMQSLGASPRGLAGGLLLLALGGATLASGLAAFVEPASLRGLHELLREQASLALVRGIEAKVFRRVGSATLYLEERQAPREGETLRGRGLLFASGGELLVAQEAALSVLPGPELRLHLRHGELHRELPAGPGRAAGFQRLRFESLQRRVPLTSSLRRHFAFLGRRARRGPLAALGKGLAALTSALLATTLILLGAGRPRWLLAGLAALLSVEALHAVAAPAASWRFGLEVALVIGCTALLLRGHLWARR